MSNIVPYGTITADIEKLATMAVRAPIPKAAPATRTDWRASNELTDGKFNTSERFFSKQPGMCVYDMNTLAESKDAKQLEGVRNNLTQNNLNVFVCRDKEGQIVAVISDWQKEHDYFVVALDKPGQGVTVSDKAIQINGVATIDDIANGTTIKGDSVPLPPCKKRYIDLQGHSSGMGCVVTHDNPKCALTVEATTANPCHVQFDSKAKNTDFILYRDTQLKQCRHSLQAPASMLAEASAVDTAEGHDLETNSNHWLAMRQLSVGGNVLSIRARALGGPDPDHKYGVDVIPVAKGGTLEFHDKLRCDYKGDQPETHCREFDKAMRAAAGKVAMDAAKEEAKQKQPAGIGRQ